MHRVPLFGTNWVCLFVAVDSISNDESMYLRCLLVDCSDSGAVGSSILVIVNLLFIVLKRLIKQKGINLKQCFNLRNRFNSISRFKYQK